MHFATVFFVTLHKKRPKAFLFFCAVTEEEFYSCPYFAILTRDKPAYFGFFFVRGGGIGTVKVLKPKRERVFATVRLAAISAIIYMLAGFATFQIIPGALLGLFNASEEMLKLGIPALRTISLSFIFAGFSVISISACQALGKSIYSLFVSVGRQLVVLIPAAYLLSLIGEVKYVWWAFPIAEIMSVALCTVFLIKVMRSAFANSSKTENRDE